MKSLAGFYEDIHDNQEKEVIYTDNEWERRSKLDICKDPIFKYVFSRQVDETLHHAVYLIEIILGISIHSITQMDRDSYNIHPTIR